MKRQRVLNIIRFLWTFLGHFEYTPTIILPLCLIYRGYPKVVVHPDYNCGTCSEVVLPFQVSMLCHHNFCMRLNIGFLLTMTNAPLTHVMISDKYNEICICVTLTRE